MSLLKPICTRTHFAVNSAEAPELRRVDSYLVKLPALLCEGMAR